MLSGLDPSGEDGLGDAVMIAYFAFYSRHRLVAQAAEEELAAIEQTEAERDSKA